MVDVLLLIVKKWDNLIKVIQYVIYVKQDIIQSKIVKNVLQ